MSRRECILIKDEKQKSLCNKNKAIYEDYNYVLILFYALPSNFSVANMTIDILYYLY